MFRPISALIAAFALILLCQAAQAQSCAPVVRDAATIASWTDPHPTPGDFKLPLPGAMSLVFTVVQLGSGQVWGNEKSTYKMGSSELRVFETPLQVRVGSSIFDRSRQSVLMIGKYELSKAQYAAILGNGRLEDGVEALFERSGDPRVKEVLADYVQTGGTCHRVLTRNIAELLAEPITFLRYSDFVEVIDRLNELCITTPNCRRLLTQLGSNPDFPGFVRLPSEIEWEFIARGGGAFIKGDFPRNVLQADLPPIAPGATLDDYAHINNSPPRLTAIGSRKDLFGFYDLLGNADELMQNPFTSENGYGAVGAYVARGGHFRLPLEEVRVSKRVELTVFRRDEQTGEFFPQAFPYTGLRLMIGLPVAGATSRTGSDELAQWFAEGWEPPEAAGDIAGGTIAEANSLGRLTQTGLRAADEVDGNDRADFFAFELLEFAKLRVVPRDVSGPARLRIVDDSSNLLGELQLTPGSDTPLVTASLIPRRYYLEVTPLDGRTDEVKYALDISREVEPDTGIARPETAALRSATPISQRRAGSFKGYVGEGDRVDTYPISVNDAQGGLQIRLSGYSGEVTIRYLDERQQVLVEATDTGGQAIDLVSPAAINSRGFIQVAASDRTSTLYELEIKSIRTHDPAFATKASTSGVVGTPRKDYVGYLSPSTPRLILPVNIANLSRLRAELTGLKANVDLEVLDKGSKRVSSNHQRSGTQPEFFEQELEGGRYFLQLTLARGEPQTPFALRFDATRADPSQSSDPAVLRRAAQAMGTLSEFGASVTGSSKGEVKYYTLTAPPGESVMLLDLLVSSASSDLDLFLEDERGKVLANSANSGSAAESIRYRTNGGKYYVRVVSVGGGSNIYFTLQASSLTEPKDPTVSMSGLVAVNQDWKVFREGDTCKMISVAEDVTPAIGWRTVKPFFFVSVDKGKDSVIIYMDNSEKLDGEGLYSGTPEVFVEYSNGRRKKVSGRWDKYWLKPIHECGGGQAGMCADNASIGGFRQGTNLLIVGRTPSGEDTLIRYSLRGYTKSAQQINRTCGGKANWIWQNG